MKLRSVDSAPIVRENIEWCRIWVPDSAKPDLSIPRVLLIGDSIVMGYGDEVEKNLAGKASVARLGTSRFASDPALLDEIAMVLRYTPFDIIHFNNGLHGFDNSDESYAGAMPEVLAAIRKDAPLAKLTIATSTPMRNPQNLQEWHSHAERIKLRNAMVWKLAAQESLPVDDLFDVVLNHPEYYSPDGTHFNAEGNAALGTQVAAEIVKSLTA
jgi:lysophospholipase L1-like esterase